MNSFVLKRYYLYKMLTFARNVLVPLNYTLNQNKFKFKI